MRPTNPTKLNRRAILALGALLAACGGARSEPKDPTAAAEKAETTENKATKPEPPSAGVGKSDGAVFRQGAFDPYTGWSQNRGYGAGLLLFDGGHAIERHRVKCALQVL